MTFANWGGYGSLPKDLWALLISQYVTYAQLKRLCVVNGSVGRLARAQLDARHKRPQAWPPHLPADSLSYLKATSGYLAVHFTPSGLLAIVENPDLVSPAMEQSSSCMLTFMTAQGNVRREPIRLNSVRDCLDIHVARTTSPSGSTFAGMSLSASAGSVGVSASQVCMYVADVNNRVSVFSERGKLLRSLQLGVGCAPSAIAMDAKSESVFVANSRGKRYRAHSHFLSFLLVIILGIFITI